MSGFAFEFGFRFAVFSGFALLGLVFANLVLYRMSSEDLRIARANYTPAAVRGAWGMQIYTMAIVGIGDWAFVLAVSDIYDKFAAGL